MDTMFTYPIFLLGLFIILFLFIRLRRKGKSDGHNPRHLSD